MYLSPGICGEQKQKENIKYFSHIYKTVKGDSNPNDKYVLSERAL